MVMNPRTHPKGAKPDFTLPKANPNPSRMTDALWWLVCMREALEPASQNGGTFANKAGSHNAGENLRDFGQGDRRTDHSIRDPFNRSGKWWKEFCAAHDWTFPDAQRGDFRTIDKYTSRLISAMKDPKDLRPDDVYFYTIGQADNDRVVEGYNERDDDDETGDPSHLWHRHDSFRRNIIGSFPHMWKALTIDMGWSYADWQKSIAAPVPPVKPKPPVKPTTPAVPQFKNGSRENSVGKNNFGSDVATLQRFWGIKDDGHYGPTTARECREYQDMRGLGVDGIAGKNTWAPILREINKN